MRWPNPYSNHNWRRWFAWRPVTVHPSLDTVWLEYIERRPTEDPYSVGWDYRYTEEKQ